MVRRNGTIVFESYRGMADRSTSEPISATTRFQIASISKAFTAVAVLLQVEAGRLALHGPIARWLHQAGSPDRAGGLGWGPAGDRITIHHLLTHTSGLGHWPSYPELDLLHPIDPARELAIFQSRPPIFEPGTRWAYSSPGYVVLAELVERAACQPYRRVVQERILDPAGLHETFVGNGIEEPMLARGYQRGEPAEPFELDTVGRGAGDLWSTARDLSLWMSSLEAPTILSPAGHHLMLTRQAAVRDPDPANPIPPTHYGYGVGFRRQDGEPLVFHTGHNPGFRSVAGFLIERSVAFAYLSNDETADLAAVMRELQPTLTGNG